MTKCPRRIVTRETKCTKRCPLYIEHRRCAREFGTFSGIGVSAFFENALHRRTDMMYREWWLEASNYTRKHD